MWDWHRVAARIGLPAEEAAKRVSASEFLRWRLIFAHERELDERTKSDWYMARICYWLWLLRRRVGALFGSADKDVPFEEFFHKAPGRWKPPPTKVERSKEQAALLSAALGVKVGD